jgi:hypothetical protein
LLKKLSFDCVLSWVNAVSAEIVRIENKTDRIMPQRWFHSGAVTYGFRN